MSLDVKIFRFNKPGSKLCFNLPLLNSVITNNVAYF